ncbi:MAG TPA: glycine betaine ABC transporter substrate-binding protein [Polyangia bacterium]|jgi:osmoprotectant transport system permease protein
MRSAGGAVAVLAGLALLATGAAGPEPTVRIGSKSFTEGVVLGDVLTDLARSAGADAVAVRALGGSRVLFDALRRGGLDAYVEYTGTLRFELLAGAVASDDELPAALARLGLHMSAPLGFEDTYALAVPEALAARLGLRTISDLRHHPELRCGFSSEFMARADGWPRLRQVYALPQRDVRGLEHDLAYRAIGRAAIDVTDVYTTDPEISYYRLRVLADDRGAFPVYRAVILHRADLARRAPRALLAMRRLEGQLDEPRMRRLNGLVKLDHLPADAVAASFVAARFGVPAPRAASRVVEALLRPTAQHLFLTAVSLAAAIALGVPAGVLAARRRRLGQVLLGILGIVQTIPSLALLVFMLPLLGIGTRPAVAALFLYGLLPIVRSTFVGLATIAPELRESAAALGLPPRTILWRIELPLAAQAILAGIKTSAVINVGTATLGALVGAGGYGQSILTGIRLDDLGLIMAGAVPAALLALVFQGAFGLIERACVPAGLRPAP